MFEGLAVASSEAAKAHFQRHPVIFATFKDIKPTTWERCFESILGILSDLYAKHAYLLTEGNLAPHEARLFTEILERRASFAVCVESLEMLSRLLARHHRERVIILIDEYDSPIHAGYTHRYYDEVVAFFRDFLSGALKDNAELFKGVLTGILRVARESLFSGLNNIDVFSILRPQLATAFGFTEPEVRALAESSGRVHRAGARGRAAADPRARLRRRAARARCDADPRGGRSVRRQARLGAHCPSVAPVDVRARARHPRSAPLSWRGWHADRSS